MKGCRVWRWLAAQCHKERHENGSLFFFCPHDDDVNRCTRSLEMDSGRVAGETAIKKRVAGDGKESRFPLFLACSSAGRGDLAGESHR